MSVMSELDLFVNHPGELGVVKRCTNCGRTEAQTETPITTVVADWRIDVMCDGCVATFDWSDWTFDPLLNVYRRK